jgi:TPR repeat protein
LFCAIASPLSALRSSSETIYQQAADLYRAAAEQGDVRAEFNFTSLYMEGKGVPLDYVRADFWYTLAASAGDSLSARKLKDLERLMTPRQFREVQTRLSNQQRDAYDSSGAGLGATQLLDKR